MNTSNWPERKCLSQRRKRTFGPEPARPVRHSSRPSQRCEWLSFIAVILQISPTSNGASDTLPQHGADMQRVQDCSLNHGFRCRGSADSAPRHHLPRFEIERGYFMRKASNFFCNGGYPAKELPYSGTTRPQAHLAGTNPRDGDRADRSQRCASVASLGGARTRDRACLHRPIFIRRRHQQAVSTQDSIKSFVIPIRRARN